MWDKDAMKEAHPGVGSGKGHMEVGWKDMGIDGKEIWEVGVVCFLLPSQAGHLVCQGRRRSKLAESQGLGLPPLLQLFPPWWEEDGLTCMLAYS